MLHLVFHLGPDRYALAAHHVVEILPAVTLRRLPRATAGLAGICHFRGQPVPVLDLCVLVLERPAAARLSTRLVMVKLTPGAPGEGLIGLLAERATSLLRCDSNSFSAPGAQAAAAPFLGRVASRDGAYIQRLELDRLLTPALRAELFPEVQPC